tara:strand:+ start:164 stop:1525 length:1362 start_codon:yes stop_codon:yes gene_type:complete
LKTINSYLSKSSDSSPLVVFRIAFGILMFISMIRFWLKGWIEELYINPKFHFSYFGFDWVKPFGDFTYILFIVCALSSILVSIGYKYRFSIIIFFLSFTYIELMDKTTYLNHYYLISILSFLMIFLPASSRFSVDSFKSKKSYKLIPKWSIDSIKLLICIVYFYAGLAKINSDWLIEAMPLKIWLTSKYDLPIIGESLVHLDWFHYLMSWGGMIYDLSIPFLLLYSRTRLFAFVMVVFFHLFTVVLFPIGMFPYIMIFSALIFFSSKFHLKIIFFISSFFKNLNFEKYETTKNVYSFQKIKATYFIILFFFIFQILFPLRNLLYDGELFWNERGYRYSWRVMLMEKIGYTTLKIEDNDSGKSFYINNSDFLTPFQEKQMSFQPDFIIEYAHHVGDYYKEKGYKNLSVFADSHVALNGRKSQRFIDPNINLYQQKRSLKNYEWVLPFKDEIRGF